MTGFAPPIARTRYVLATGEIEYSVIGPEGLTGFPDEPGRGWADGQAPCETHYVAGGRITPRPATGLPETQALAVGADWIVPDVPEGTRVKIDGEDIGVADADGLVLVFAAPGVWRVTLAPPLPWRPASCEVTVA